MLFVRNENHIIKVESQVSEIFFPPLLPTVTLSTAVAQMPLKHSAFVVSNGKNQVSSRYWLFHEGLRLKYICLT